MHVLVVCCGRFCVVVRLKEQLSFFIDLWRIIRNYSLMTAKTKNSLSRHFCERSGQVECIFHLRQPWNWQKPTHSHETIRVYIEELYARHVQRMKCYAKQNQIAAKCLRLVCSLNRSSIQREYTHKVNGVRCLFSLSHRRVSTLRIKSKLLMKWITADALRCRLHGWINNRMKLKTLENYKCDY